MLGFRHRSHSLGRVLEDRHDSIADRLNDRSTLFNNAFPQDIKGGS